MATLALPYFLTSLSPTKHSQQIKNETIVAWLGVSSHGVESDRHPKFIGTLWMNVSMSMMWLGSKLVPHLLTVHWMYSLKPMKGIFLLRRCKRQRWRRQRASRSIKPFLISSVALGFLQLSLILPNGRMSSALLTTLLLHMAACLLLTHTFLVKWHRSLKRKSKCCQKSRTWLSHMIVAQQMQSNKYTQFTLPLLIFGRPTWLKAMKHQVCHIVAPKLPTSFSRLILCYVTAPCIKY